MSSLDIVYPVKFGNFNPELKVSLRTLDNFRFDTGMVVVAGFIPDWYRGYGIEVKQHPVHRFSNTTNILEAVCNDPNISDNFILMNDDFFCMGYPDKGILNDDLAYDIISAYEEVHSNGMRKETSSNRVLRYAPQTIQALRECRGIWRTSREAWYEIYENLSYMAEYENSLPESERYRVRSLGWQGGTGMLSVEEIQQFLIRHGRGSSEHGDRPYRQQWGLLQRELSMGQQNPKLAEYDTQQVLNIRRANALLFGMGNKNWNTVLDILQSGSEERSFDPNDIGKISDKRYPIASLPVFHRGPMKPMVDATSFGNQYAEDRIKAYTILCDLGFSNPLNYDVHVPMIINKKIMLEVLRMLDGKLGHSHKRSIYGNIARLGGNEIIDPKVVNNKDWSEDMVFISTSDDTFRIMSVGKYLKKKFKNKSVYEI